MQNLTYQDILSNTKLVVLECPWENWENEYVRDMFSKMALLKKKGYGPKWSKGMMPVDSTDLIGDHVIACYQDPSGELHPYTAGRSVTYKKCEEYHLSYPPMDYFNSDSKMDIFKDITNKDIKNNNKGAGISYYSSWTIDPDFRVIDKNISKLSKDLYSAMTFYYHKAYEIPQFFCFAVLKFKTDTFFSSWGCQRVAIDGVDLPNVVVPRYSDFELGYMKLDQFSDELKLLANNFKDLWDSRITINSNYKTNEELLDPVAA